MNSKNKYWLIAGSLSFLTFLLHLVGGQIDLANPMIDSSLAIEKSAQLVGVWNMVTLVLLMNSYILVCAGLGRKYYANIEMIKLIGLLNLSFCLPFIITSFYYGLFVPQWIFFLPIGLLIFKGLSAQSSK